MDFNDDLRRKHHDRLGREIHDRLTQAGADPGRIELDISPDDTAELRLAGETVIAFGQNGPNEYSETPYWMAAQYDPDGGEQLIFDGSEDESALWTLLAERLRQP